MGAVDHVRRQRCMILNAPEAPVARNERLLQRLHVFLGHVGHRAFAVTVERPVVQDHLQFRQLPRARRQQIDLGLRQRVRDRRLIDIADPGLGRRHTAKRGGHRRRRPDRRPGQEPPPAGYGAGITPTHLFRHQLSPRLCPWVKWVTPRPGFRRPMPATAGSSPCRMSPQPWCRCAPRCLPRNANYQHQLC